VRLVLREGATLVGLGLLIGLPGIYSAGMLMRGVLVGVSPLDPPTLLAVSFGLATVALLACYLPARRVLRTDPAHSLRQEVRFPSSGSRHGSHQRQRHPAFRRCREHRVTRFTVTTDDRPAARHTDRGAEEDIA
jgi:hypothetical protein